MRSGSRLKPARALAECSVHRANATHAADTPRLPLIHDSPAALIEALHQVERELGRPRATFAVTPERVDPDALLLRVRGERAIGTLLSRRSQPPFDGAGAARGALPRMGASSGYAPESTRALWDCSPRCAPVPPRCTSAWLDLVSESVNQLQPVTQRLVLEHRPGAG